MKNEAPGVSSGQCCCCSFTSKGATFGSMLGMSNWEETPGQIQNSREASYTCHQGLRTTQEFPGGILHVRGKSGTSCLTCCNVTPPWISSVMNGWMDLTKYIFNTLAMKMAPSQTSSTITLHLQHEWYLNGLLVVTLIITVCSLVFMLHQVCLHSAPLPARLFSFSDLNSIPPGLPSFIVATERTVLLTAGRASCV